ncbi:MAG TPA: cytochrome P450 [Acidimicrobiia bacterium]|nr:cytochrome P450 [Acidimicrobiia bacterium]
MVDSARVIDVPVLDDDPFDPAVLVDPYAFYERMREAGPVVFLERYGVWAFARHAEVAEALGDWETYSSAAGVGLADFRKEAPWRPPSLLLEADPPVHSVVRRPMLHLMTPKVAHTLRPAFSAAAEELVETLVSQGEFDGVTDLAEIYPVHVFADAIGLPEDGRHHLLPYAAMTFNAFGPANALRDEAFAGSEPVIEWATAACQRDALSPGGFGAQIWEAVDRDEITAEEAPLLVRSLLAAGLDTTVGALGNALFCLATNPDQYELLHADPKLAKPAFEEAMRLESPIQAFFRTTSCPVEVGGAEIPADAKVILFFGSANRDPLRWGEHADRYDVHHRAAGHVAFGAGVHVCIGQFIARLEGELVLSALARRAATLRLTGDPVPKPNNTLKAFRHLPLRITAGGT